MNSEAREYDTIKGVVERIVFCNSENGWGVIRIETETEGEVTVVGVMGTATVGETMEARGKWVFDKRFGRQFRADAVIILGPSSLSGIKKYLSSTAIRGVGPELADRIVDHFGLETLEVLSKNPKKLKEISGIGKKKAKLIAQSWSSAYEERELLIQLFGVGLGPGAAHRIIARYGNKAMIALKENPYDLAEHVEGIGFITADKIATELGIPKDSEYRVDAGVVYSLKKAVEEGHTFLPLEELETRAEGILGVESNLVRLSVERLLSCFRLAEDHGGIYLPEFLDMEISVAKRIADLAFSIRSPESSSKYEEALLIELDEDQRKAVRQAFETGLLVVTGGPGTGKTTLVRQVCRLARAKGVKVLLCAPTGRAARRLEEATGRNASTIHRLLEFDPISMTFGRNEMFPLKADLVVVDETSMVDLPLMTSLLVALPRSCGLLLVGDSDQLPPVGAGAVLRETICSGKIPTIRLSRVHRQALTSLIVVNAHRVNHGDFPLDESEGSEKDFYFVRRESPEEITEAVLELTGTRISGLLGVDPIRDVQVVSPMRRGPLGTRTLNRKLQALLNPEGDEVKKGEDIFRTGDRVMQIKNNYQKMIFNGEQGVIFSIDGKERQLAVSFDGKFVPYDFNELDELSLAYVSTVHKAQGSEYPAVVVVLHTQHYIMLRRNLLYTALTRGKRLVVLVGSKRALAIAVKNDRVDYRHSKLAFRLTEQLPTP